MRRTLVWFLLCCKRYLKKPPFLLLFCLLPLTGFFFGQRGEDGPQQVRIAVCALGGGGTQASGGLSSLSIFKLPNNG